jgi:hypothetical protein
VKRLLALIALAAAGAVLVVPAASAGDWLSLAQGRAQIKSALRATQIGTQFASKVDTCYKPRHDRVRCFFQTREHMTSGDWYHCYGTAVAANRWYWISVTFNRGWFNDCYSGAWEPFLA